MARNRRKPQPAGITQPPWLITYSDLMTLLLTFFVLLVAISVIDERRRVLAVGSVAGSFGQEQGTASPREPADGRPVPGVVPMGDAPPRGRDLTPLRDMLWEDAERDINYQENGYIQIFSINDEVLFRTGSTDLTERGAALLARVAPVLRGVEHPVLIAGHASPARDEEGILFRLRGDEKDLPTPWRLSLGRATAVYRKLSDLGVPRGRMLMEAHGDTRPRFDNLTPDGRRANRRVDIVLDRRNAEWARRMESLKEGAPVRETFQYKGFRFDFAMPGGGAGSGGASGAGSGQNPGPESDQESARSGGGN
ncbi:OmpA family protein [Desulfovibrio oxamicus]|uniref:OmpA family protein n=1 Tax=Nitratidesulfovibrio oxamicus TaxID=32016 RepID=A0ABS0J317_9BACT|nr:flagellar motor protein MotB [Nitratidesulfovibrio oxamicus]MBG3876814.1 OmpA family protein [Nitratidesulfovibrio oxamicus]